MSTAYDSPMIIRSTAAQGHLRANRAFEELVGLTSKELAARDLEDWLHPDDREAFGAQTSCESGAIRARHATGCDAWVEVEWSIQEHKGERVVLGRSPAPAVHSDVRSDEVETRARSSLHETLEAMARIVERKNPGMLCSILLVDGERVMVIDGVGPSLPDAYNRAVEGLRIGPTVGSCGTATFWNTPVVVEDIANDPLWRDLRDAAEIADVSACWSHPVTTAQGEVLGAMALYHREPCGPTRAQMDGLEIAARMVGLSIERNRLEEQLRRTMKLEAIGVLAGGIAHDFNNLLGAVLGNAELMLNTLPESSEMRGRLEEIVTASVRASDLCKQLLAYAGRGAMTAESVECNDLVREIGGLMQVTLSKKARLVYELADEELGLRADRGQLHRVLMNLMTNAAEAVGDTEGEIAIGTRARTLYEEDLAHAAPNSALQPGEYVELWVRDTGSGMAPEDKHRIFDPFFTQKGPGRGLGLAAVQGVVRGHGGAVAVESELGAGTTFTLLLPRVAIGAAATADERPGACLGGGRVLLVDDDKQVRRVVGEMLEMAGYAVETADDGRDGVRAFKANPSGFDCVLMDLSMPHMSGEEAFHEMLAIRPDVPIVLTSGFTEQEMMDRFEGNGLAGFLQKPARMGSLVEKVSAAVRGAGIPSR